MANKTIRYGIGFDVDTTSLDQVRTKLQSLSNISIKELKFFNPQATNEQLEKMKLNVQTAAKEIENALANAYNPKLDTINITKFNQNIGNSSMSIKQMEQSFNALGANGKNAFIDMTKHLFTTQREIKKTSGFLDSLGKTFANTIKWSIASSAIQLFTRSVANAWGYIKGLDESLNNIMIVTNKSASYMENFAQKATKAAKELGSSTKAYTNASLIYYQQGLSDDDVESRTNVTIKTANVTGQSAAEVSEQLTAVWNGYKVVAEDAEKYIDKLAAVAASTAADLQELSEGMSKVASGANAMGVDIDQLTAQLSTIISVTRQDASSVGTALKTIFARMGDLKVDGVDEFGVSLGDVSGTLKKVGIEVLDQNGNLREMGTVMEEVASKWGTWTEAQQQAIAVAMAGKRQYNNLLALFENWDMYENALAVSQNSEGTLESQQEIRMDSLDAKLNKLKATGEGVYNSLFDSDSMKGFIDGLSNVLEMVDHFVQAIGGGGDLLLALGSVATQVFSNQIAGGISNVITNIKLQNDAYKQTQAEFEISRKYENISEEANKRLVDMYKKGLDYNKVMTEEEKKELDILIQETAELEKQKNIEKEKFNSAKDFYSRNKNKGDNGQAVEYENLSITDRQQLAERYVKSSKDLSSTAREADKLAQSGMAFEDKRADFQTRLKGFYDEKDINTFVGLGSEGIAGAGTQVQGAIEALEGDIRQRQSAEVVNPEEIQALEKKKALLQEIANEIEKYQNAQDEIIAGLNKLINVEEIDSKSKQTLKETLAGLEKGTISVADANKILAKEASKLGKEFNEQSSEILKGSSALDTLNIKSKNAGDAFKRFVSSLNTKAIISGVTKLVGAVGSLGSVITSVINLTKIFRDDSLSDIEKWGQALTAIGMIVAQASMVFGGITNAINLFKAGVDKNNISLALNLGLQRESTEEQKRAALAKVLDANATKLVKKALSDEQKTRIINNILQDKTIDLTDEEAVKKILLAKVTDEVGEKGLTAGAKGLLGGKMMGKGATAALGVWGLLAAAIIGIIAAIVLLTKKTDDSNSKFKELANENLKQVQEAVKNVSEEIANLKDVYNNLIHDIEDYQGAVKAIDKMKEGTVEWKNAVIELNTQVLDLINKYPTLANYLQSQNGLLTIGQEGFDAVIEDTRAKISDATLKQISTQATLYEAKTDGVFANIQDQINNNLKGFSVNSLATSQISSIVNKDGSISDRNRALLTNAKILEDFASGYSNNNQLVYQIKEEGFDIDKLINANKEFLNNIESKYDNISLDSGLETLFTNEKFIEDFLNNVKNSGSDENAIFSKENLKEVFLSTAGISEGLEDNSRLNSAIDSLIGTFAENNNLLSESIKAMELQAEATMVLKDTYLRTLGEEEKVNDTETLSNIGKNLIQDTDLDYNKYFEQQKKSIEYDAGSDNVLWTENIEPIRKKIRETYGDGADDNSVIIKGLGLAELTENARNTTEFLEYSFKVIVDGIEKEITGRQLLLDASAKQVKNEVQNDTANLINLLSELEKNNKNTQLAYLYAIQQKWVTSEQVLRDWETMTLSDIKKLEAAAQNENSEYKLENGDTISLDQKNITNITDAFRSKLDKDITDFKNYLDSLGFENTIEGLFDDLSSSDLKSLEKNIAMAITVGGNDGKDALVGILNNINTSQDLKAFYDAIKTTTWTSLESVGTFIDTINNLGYEVREDFLNNFVSGPSLWLSQLDSVRSKISDIITLTKDIKLGDIISEDDYNKLITVAPALASFFTLTAEGYKSLYSGEAMKELALTPFRDFTDVNEIGTSANNFINIAKEKGISYKNNNNLITESEIISYFNALNRVGSGDDNDGLKNLYRALGFSPDQIDAAFATINSDISKSSAEYRNAFDYVKTVISSVNEVFGSGKEFNIQDAASTWANTFIESWDDFTNTVNLKTILSAEDYNKLGEGLMINSLNQLGIASKDFLSHLIETSTDGEYKNYEKLIKFFEDAQLAGIDLISTFSLGLDNISKKIDLTFGANKIQLLEDFNNAANAYVKAAVDQEAAAKSAQNELLSESALTNLENSYGIQLRDETGKILTDNALITELKRIVETTENESLKNDISFILSIYEKAESAAAAVYDAVNTAIDGKLQSYEMSIQLKIDASEMERQLNELNAKYLKEGNLLEELTGSQAYDLATKQFGQFSNDFSTYIDALEDLDTISSDLQNRTYWDTYKTKIDGASDSLNEMFSLAQEMSEAYLSIQEEIVALYEEQVDRISNINDMYKTSIELMSLVWKNTDNFSKNASDYLKYIKENAIIQNELALEQLDAAKKAYEDYSNAPKEMKETLEENLINATNQALQATQDLFDAVNEEFKQSLLLAIDSVFAESSLNGFTQEWERDLYFDERYLDEVNKSYKLADFEKKILQSIDKTDNYSAQQKLNKLREQELDILKRKDKLTQADFDRANARYELELRRIALEESQQTATKMKLVRDINGAYTYQYVADEDAVAKAESEYQKAENDLYNLNKEQEKDLINTLTQKYQEAADAIANAESPEEKEILNNFYFGQNGVITLLKDELSNIGTEGAQTGTYLDSVYKSTIDGLLAINPESVGEKIAGLIGDSSTKTGLFGEIDKINTTLNTLLGPSGSLGEAIDSISNNIVKKDTSPGEYYFDNVFGEEGQLAKANGILIDLTKEDGILSKIKEYAEELSGFMSTYKSAYMPNGALDKNTNALNSLTNALLLQQDLLDGKLDGKQDETTVIKIDGWTFNEGVWEQIDQT